MKLSKAKKVLKKVLKKELKLDFEFTEKSDSIKATNSLTIAPYDDSIFTEILVFASGSVGFDFVFDKLALSYGSLEALQAFNAANVWLTAFVREDGYLVLRHNAAFVSDDNLEEYVKFILNSVAKNELEKTLVPLTELTEAAN